MISMSSTLVETVSINYEDFNESFLTCGTCLCMYDGGEHTPKLLACSHTVCLHCLSRIASQNPAAPTFRCPICRENITVPRGGVAALPPSFLVNQLLDLMASQRREVVPKCSVHFNQELLFCETCDTVFCSQCTSGSHSSSAASGSSATHTVIPFSIAIKRMSEILLYKANECISKLGEAEEAVKGEVDRLEDAARVCLERVETLFSEAHAAVEARRQAVVEQINAVRDAKLKILRAQLDTIQAEKDKVTSECDGLQYQVEVRNISQRISALSEKLESVSVLSEPRENSFIECTLVEGCLSSLEQGLKATVRTTTTFPGLSTLASLGEHVVNLECRVILTTVDYDGNVRMVGGDPVVALILAPNNQLIPADVEDKNDGTYHIKFRPSMPGRYELKVKVVDRPVKQTPFVVEVGEHNNPIVSYGSRGSAKDQLSQPVAITYHPATKHVYVVDTGNSRIKVLTKDLALVKHLDNTGLDGRSCTGIACYNSPASEPWLVIVNWRTQAVTRMTLEGETLSSFTHCGFQEPIDIAVDSTYGHILVADNGPSCVFVFDTEGKFLFEVGKKGSAKGSFNLISGVTVGPEGEIIVADSRIQVFSAKGDFLQEIYPQGKGKGRYGGITVDSEGHILGSRSEKGKSEAVSVGSDGGQHMRRTASLDTIYLRGHWPRESLYLSNLQVDRSTQTEDWLSDPRKALRHQDPTNEDKLEKLMRHRIQRTKEGSSRERTAAFSLLGGDNHISHKHRMRSSIEGLNQEIERLVLRSTPSLGGLDREERKTVESTPEGHRAPVADLLRETRSVNTQTPAFTAPSSGPSSQESPNGRPVSNLSDSRLSSEFQDVSEDSSPEQEGRGLGTSPRINKFLAREPPDGCERVSTRFTEDRRPMVDISEVDYPLKPSMNFQLKPSLGSAFQPLRSTQ